MLFFQKKRMILIAYLLLISLFSCIYLSKEYEEKISPVMASPATGKTIVLDSGHGLPDSGAVRCKWNSRKQHQFANSKKGKNTAGTKWM